MGRSASVALAAAALSCVLAWSGAATALASTPTNVERPEVQVSASLRAGEPLICYPGSWLGQGITFSYKWLRNGVIISGATGSVHTIVSADRGDALSCFVKATDKEGSSESESSNSVTIPLEVGVKPEPTADPEVSGSAAVGATLACSTGKWKGTPAPTFAYSWRRDHATIEGASASTYKVMETDKGYAMSCRVIATNSAGSASAISANSIEIPGPPTVSKAPAVSGTPTVGEQLTCSPGEWGGAPPPSFQYQWLLEGKKIELATARTYTVQPTDVGHNLSCRVTATNGEGETSATSAAVPVPLTAGFSVSDAQEIAGSGSGFATGELSVVVGQTVDYQITVRNTGNVSLKLTSFTDAGCVNIAGPGRAEIEPTESTTYTCERTITSSGSYANEASVEAAPPKGDGAPLAHTSNKVLASVSTRPIVETGAASEELQRTAVVNASVDPNGKTVTGCKFEYGSTSLKSSTPCSKLPGAGSTAVAVLAHLAGLTPGTTYHFRISATSASGTSKGEEGAFKTLPAAAPSVKTEGATEVLQSTAILTADVDPNGAQVSVCKFEYGTTSLNRTVSCSKLPGSGTSEVAVSAALKGLTAATTYHFRISATSASGTTKGAEGTFVTG